MDQKSGKKWECSKCSKTFKRGIDLTNHMLTHDPDAKVKCEVCGKISKNEVTLSSHIRYMHTSRKRPSCDTCHQMFSTIGTLGRHIDAVHNTKERPRFPCTFPHCEKTYLNKDKITWHVKTEHAQNPVRYPCTLCGEEFKRRAHLESHIPTHTTEKPYMCTTCGRGFSQITAMKRHEMTHLEKSARARSKCDVCPQAFLTRAGLQNHIRIAHENQIKHPCSFCDKSFSDTRDLKRHVEARHATNKGLNIHSCKKCEYKSHSKHNFATHLSRHEDPKHECYFCWKKFVIFQNLVRHLNCTHTLEK